MDNEQLVPLQPAAHEQVGVIANPDRKTIYYMLVLLNK
jgi:hypothetical protein